MPEKLNISEEAYNELAEHIASEQSVVGIDAKKTHILILHLLIQLQNKVDALEKQVIALKDGK